MEEPISNEQREKEARKVQRLLLGEHVSVQAEEVGSPRVSRE